MMILVYNPLTKKVMYHLVENDSFNYTSLQNVRVLCGRRVNVRTSFRDIADVIKEGRLCKHCHESYIAEISAGRA
jgi:hypothetical protein